MMKKLSLVLLCLVQMYVHASTMDSTTKIIHQKIKQNELTDAILILNDLLESYPNNSDLIKWKANMHSWTNQHDSAIYILHQLPNYETDTEARNIVTTCYVRLKQLDQALDNNKITLQYDSINKEARFLEVQILFLQEKWRTCLEKSKLSICNSNKIKEFSILAANKLFTQKINLQYLILHNKYRTGQLAEISYQGKYKSMAYSLQVRKLSQTSIQSYQAQVEAYKAWKKHGYSYGTLAISDSKGFPLFHAGVVHFLPIQKQVETDFGFRYYKSQSQAATYVPSAGTSLQINRINCQYRYYHIINQNFSGHTHSASIKRIFRNPEQYIKLDGSTGIQTDQLSGQYLNTKKVSIGNSVSIFYQMPIKLRLLFSIHTQYSQTTIDHKFITKTITSSLKLSYKFNTKK